MRNNILGAEGIVVHGDKIVLGMQKKKRWYSLENGEKAAIIKTLGGAIEEIDKNSTRNALIREILEEIKGIGEKDIKVSSSPVFTKDMGMRELNPYEKESTLRMKADFYIVEIPKEIEIKPNDLPALIEIPIKEFIQIYLNIDFPIYNIINYITKTKKEIEIPENCAIMVPNDLKDFLRDHF